MSARFSSPDTLVCLKPVPAETSSCVRPASAQFPEVERGDQFVRTLRNGPLFVSGKVVYQLVQIVHVSSPALPDVHRIVSATRLSTAMSTIAVRRGGMQSTSDLQCVWARSQVISSKS